MHVVVCAGEAGYRARYGEPDKRDGGRGRTGWPVPWWYVDAGAALLLLLLAAVDEGLQAAFVGVRDPGALAARSGSPRASPIGVALVGHGAPDKPSRSLPPGPAPAREEVLHRERRWWLLRHGGRCFLLWLPVPRVVPRHLAGRPRGATASARYGQPARRPGQPRTGTTGPTCAS